MLFKKIACLLLALTVAAQPLLVQAGDLDSAFGNLIGSAGGAVSINSPGRFNSSARSGFTAGGLELRVPRGSNSPQLFTADVPRISAGCNGISAHFGGFSFISGKEFATLLKNIASGAALGFVSSLVMKTLCPACEAVVQELKTAAQTAARLAKDSCAIGQRKGEEFAKSMGWNSDSTQYCANTANDTGAESDSLSAINSICNTVRDANKWMNDLNGTSNPGTIEAMRKRGELECQYAGGNVTWRALSAFDGAGGALGTVGSDATDRKLLLMNLMGANMKYSGEDVAVGCEMGGGGAWTAKDEPASLQKNFCPPPISTKQIVDLFMCGAKKNRDDTKMSATAKSYCNDLDVIAADGAVATKVWTCKNGDFENCPFLTLVDAGDIFKGQGFFVKINKLLTSAVDRVRTGAGYSDAEGKQIIALIQSAPYPLYQAINAAAVYPAAAADLIDTMSILVAENFANAVMEDIITLEGRSSSGKCLGQEQATEMLNFAAGMRSANERRHQTIASNFALQQGLAEQIRQLNLAIQREVMSEDLLSSNKLGESINRAVTTTNAGGASTPTTTP